MSRLEKISELLLEEIAERFDKEPLEIENLEFGQSFAEILDRLVIMNIRTWRLEDKIAASKDNNEIADLKKKVDFLFKDKRPKLWRAIGLFLDAYIDKNHHKKFSEENVKLYEGHKN